MEKNTFKDLVSPVLGVGAIAACPLCWGASASLLTFLGLGALAPWFGKVGFALLFIALIGFIIDLRKHKNIFPLVLLIIGAGMLYAGRYVYYEDQEIWIIGGIIVLLSVILNRYIIKGKRPCCVNRICNEENKLGKVTCPKCKNSQKIEIPNDKCIMFYKCEKCGEMIKPKGDDCCVFCSYGDKKCPAKHG